MTTHVATMTAGQGIVSVLRANGLTTAFGIPGIHNLGLYDALAAEPLIHHYLVRHEQGAGFAADGYARVSGKPGLAIATTGPGAYNAVTAISEAYLNSSAVLLLAGQIDAEYIGRDWGILHETMDQGAVFEQITKFVGRPRTPDELPAVVAARHPGDADRPAAPRLCRAADRPADEGPERSARRPDDLRSEAAAGSGRGRARRGAAGLGEAAADHRRHGRAARRRLGRAGARRGTPRGARDRHAVGGRRHPRRPPALRRAISSRATRP